jgi:4-hydroxybenzoate polyprenyltransferase
MEEFFGQYLRRFGKIGAFLELQRPWNATLGALMAILGILVVINNYSVLSLIAVFAVYFITWGAINSINDIYDYEIDKINTPFKPLQDKRISMKEAKAFVATSWILALAVSLFINFYLFLGIVMLIILGILYSTPPIAFERHWLTANSSLGFMFVFVPAFGGAIYATQSFNLPLLFYLLFVSFSLLVAFLLLGKDFKDIKGDKAGGKNTLLVTFGHNKSLIISIIGTFIMYVITLFSINQIIQNTLFVLLSVVIYLLILNLQLRFFRIKDRLKQANNFGMLRFFFFLFGLAVLFFLL